MKAPPTPFDEPRRLRALVELNVLDTGREEQYDRIVRLAASHFRVPIALVSLVDEKRQWFKAAHGVAVRETPREVSFCGHAILGEEPLVVPDAHADQRFCENPLVTGEPGVRFYAGQPIVTLDGYRVGTLCLIDHVPRTLGAQDLAALRDFARLVENELNNAQMHQALEIHRQDEARNVAVLQTALDCIVTIDGTGKVLEFNPAAERTLGYARADVLGRQMATLIIPERLRDAHGRGMRHFLATGEGPILGRRVEVIAMRADGSEFPVELAITPTQVRGALAFTAFLRDISVPVQARQRLDAEHAIALALAEAREPPETLARILRSICETLDWAFGNVWLPDDQGNLLANAHFWSSSAAAHREFIAATRSAQFPPDAGLPGKVWSGNAAVWIRDVVHDASFVRAPAAAKAGLHAAIAFPMRSDGRLLGVMEFFSEQAREPDQALLRLFETIGTQIGQYIERKKIEARVAQLTTELHAIFSLSPDGFLAFDRSGNTTYVNSALLSVLGLGEKEAAKLTEADFDRSFGQMCDPGEPYAKIADAPDGSRAVIRLVQPRPATLARTIRTLATRDGEPLGKIIYMRDMTGEAEVDRMKSEFLSTAAHELRTPMASIYGFSELLLKRDYDEPTRRELLETIYRQSSHLIKLINELLDLARIEGRQGKDFRLRVQQLFPVVRETVANFIVPNDARKVTITLPRQRHWVEMDTEKFQQVLLNILSNAYKYSPGGGPIELASRTRKLGKQTLIGIAVRDHGIGMTPNEVGRVFERFYRAESTTGIPGTGLGMSVAKEIMDVHHGSIEISSRSGDGTEVVLWMPEARPQPVPKETPL